MDTKDLFGALDYKDILRYIASGEEETVHLEFKTISGAEMRGRDDRKNFAKSLSGFANADGGIIIWGVQAANERASGSSAIRPLSTFRTRLEELEASACIPTIEGLRHKVLPGPNGDEGFATTYVPPSDSGPYMAKLGEDRYYMRVGSSTLRMEHFQVADMFGRRRKPILQLRVIFQRCEVQNRMLAISYKLGLENIGRGSAFAPYLEVHYPAYTSVYGYGLPGNYTYGLSPIRSEEEGLKRFGNTTEIVLHPKCIHMVSLLSYKGPIEYAQVPKYVKYAVAAEDMPLFEGVAEIPESAEVMALLRRKISGGLG